MTDTLHPWEKWPVGALVGAAGLNTAIWYVGASLAGPLGFFTQLMITLAGVASVIAIDGALIATVAGMRQGRRSRWSAANIIVTALFTGLAALAAHGVLPGIGGALHGMFALTIVTYCMHLAHPSRQGATQTDTPPVTVNVTQQVAVTSPRDTVRALVDGGVTVSEAARRVGVSRQTASRYAKRGE